MSFTLFQVGLKRVIASPLLRQNAVCSSRAAYCIKSPSRTISLQTFVTSNSRTKLPTQLHTSSRILNLLRKRTPPEHSPCQSKSFFSSSRQSLRHHPPPQRPSNSFEFLGFLNKIPQNVVFYGIIGLNVTVFTMWFMAQQKYKLERDPSAVIWMSRNFFSSWQNFSSGRVWTIVTSCFSHKDWGHILLNGFTFFFMAGPVLSFMGSRQFIFLYMTGGLISGITSMFYANRIDHQDRPSHGASGAIYSVVAFLACVAPKMTFQLYGIIPIPAWLAVTGLFAYDTYSTLADRRGTTDTVGHIGGLLAGVVYFIMLRRSGKLFKL